MRKTGIDVIGDAAWGTHFCQFYKSSQDLLDILVPYFREGLKSNEFCMWVTSQPLGVIEAREALARAVPDLDERLKKGQIEILDYGEWYTKSGKFKADEVLKGWVDKLESAQRAGYEGLRLTGNTFWLEKSDWDGFTKYEETINKVIGGYKMLAVCTYSLDKCGASEIIDVVNNHQFALIKRQDKWVMMQSAQIRKTDEKIGSREPFPHGKPNPLVKAIALITALAGVLVTLGWVFNVGVLKSLSPSWISMKFSTAFSFVLSGATLYFLAKAREGEYEKAQVALSITSLLLALLMGLLFFSSLFGVHTGIEELFIRDTGGVMSLAPGMPSMPTMVNFLLIALSAVLAIANPAGLLRRLKILGIVVGAVGALAVAGYVFNAPLLYYYLPGVNSAMALHTALLFVLLGTGLACL